MASETLLIKSNDHYPIRKSLALLKPTSKQPKTFELTASLDYPSSWMNMAMTVSTKSTNVSTVVQPCHYPSMAMRHSCVIEASSVNDGDRLISEMIRSRGKVLVHREYTSLPDMANRSGYYKIFIEKLWKHIKKDRCSIKIEIFYDIVKFNFNGFIGFSRNCTYPNVSGRTLEEIVKNELFCQLNRYEVGKEAQKQYLRRQLNKLINIIQATTTYINDAVKDEGTSDPEVLAGHLVPDQMQYALTKISICFGLLLTHYRTPMDALLTRLESRTVASKQDSHYLSYLKLISVFESISPDLLSNEASALDLARSISFVASLQITQSTIDWFKIFVGQAIPDGKIFSTVLSDSLWPMENKAAKIEEINAYQLKVTSTFTKYLSLTAQEIEKTIPVEIIQQLIIRPEHCHNFQSDKSIKYTDLPNAGISERGYYFYEKYISSYCTSKFVYISLDRKDGIPTEENILTFDQELRSTDFTIVLGRFFVISASQSGTYGEYWLWYFDISLLDSWSNDAIKLDILFKLNGNTYPIDVYEHNREFIVVNVGNEDKTVVRFKEKDGKLVESSKIRLNELFDEESVKLGMGLLLWDQATDKKFSKCLAVNKKSLIFHALARPANPSLTNTVDMYIVALDYLKSPATMKTYKIASQVPKWSERGYYSFTRSKILYSLVVQEGLNAEDFSLVSYFRDKFTSLHHFGQSESLKKSVACLSNAINSKSDDIKIKSNTWRLNCRTQILENWWLGQRSDRYLLHLAKFKINV